MEESELTNSEMKKLELHLKAEAKIKEVHTIIDDLLEEDIAPEKGANSFDWKWIAIVAFLGLSALVFWYWSNWNAPQPPPAIKENVPIKTEEEKLIPLEKAPKEEIPESKNKESIPSNEPKEVNDPDPIKNAPIKKAPPIAKAPNEKGNTNQKEIDFGKGLIAANFLPIEWEKTNSRSNTANAPDHLKTAVREKYNSKNYTEALALLLPLAKEYPQDWEMQFFKGLCQLQGASPKLEEAQQIFNQIIENDDNDYLEDANWFLVGTLLLKGEEAEAMNRLKNNFLIYPNGKYYPKAKDIIKAKTKGD